MPSIKRWRLLRRLLPSWWKRWAVLTWPGGFKVLPRQGAALLLCHRNYVDRQIALYGDFEREQIDVLLHRIAEGGCDLFIDVGANIGLYTVLVAKRGVRVLAFEPDPRNLDQLRANILINGVADRVETRAVALSDRSGEAPFAPAPAGSTGQSRLAAAGSARVTTAALDDLLTVAGQRLVLKIDIEGHEDAAIAGMRRLLAQNSCFLQIESFAGNRARLDALLGQLGFKRWGNVGDDHFFARDAGGPCVGAPAVATGVDRQPLVE